ncbi:MAG: tyrosine-type recombinase/integrase [Gammaproteobacteria bacterium]
MLTDIAIKAGKPRERPYKLFDAGGLYLIVSPSGGRWWRLNYVCGGAHKTLSLGTYPLVALKQAREKRDDLRRLLANGVDPGAVRKAAKRSGDGAFEALTREWHAKHRHAWTSGHADRILADLSKNVFPWLGGQPPADITPAELLAVLRRIEARGALETAHRVLSDCGRVFRYAIATGRAERDVAADLRGALPPTRPVRHAAITEVKAIGGLLRALDGYEGQFITRCALRLAPLLFVRPGELRAAEWREFDLEAAEWRIPTQRMKMRQVHIVPLARQALAILRELYPLTGHGCYVFPSLRTGSRPLSENTLNAALRRLGYDKHTMTSHGFRSMASTVLNESGWHHDAIERQLAHSPKDKVRATYNYAEYLPERRRLMQWWADYLDGLRAGAVVVPIKSAG